eukprot:Awhi_evm1s13609
MYKVRPNPSWYPAVINGGFGCEDNTCYWLQPETTFGSDCSVELYDDQKNKFMTIDASKTVCKDDSIIFVIPELLLKQRALIYVVCVVHGIESDLHPLPFDPLWSPAIANGGVGCAHDSCYWVQPEISFGTDCTVDLYDANKNMLLTIDHQSTRCTEEIISFYIPEEYRLRPILYIVCSVFRTDSPMFLIKPNPNWKPTILNSGFGCENNACIWLQPKDIFGSDCLVDLYDGKMNKVLTIASSSVSCSDDSINFMIPEQYKKKPVLHIVCTVYGINTDVYSFKALADWHPVIINGGVGCENGSCYWVQPETIFGTECSVDLYDASKKKLITLDATSISCGEDGINFFVPKSPMNYRMRPLLYIVILVHGVESSLYPIRPNPSWSPKIINAGFGCKDDICVWIQPETTSTFGYDCSVYLYDERKNRLALIDDETTNCNEDSISIVLPREYRQKELLFIACVVYGKKSNLYPVKRT